MRARVTIISFGFVLACSHAVAGEMDAFVEKAICSKNFMETQNISRLKDQGLISGPELRNAARNAIIKCAPYQLSGGLAVRYAMDGALKKTEYLPVWGIISLYPSGTVRAVAWNQTPFEWYLSKQEINSAAGIDRNFFDNVSAFVRAGISADERFCLGDTPLYHAVRLSAKRTIKLLIDAGANPNKKVPQIGGYGSSIPDKNYKLNEVGRRAYSGGWLDTILFASKAGNACPADDISSSNSIHLLEVAIRSRFGADWHQVLYALLDKGAKAPKDILHVFVRDRNFSLSLENDNDKKLFERLMKAGADINAVDQNGLTLLAKVLKGSVSNENVKRLRNYGAKLSL